MEYIVNGEKIIVEGDTVIREDDKPRKRKIGPNYTHGVYHGGFLSSFNQSFTDEVIGIESGLGDIVSAKIGDVKEAYVLLKEKIKEKNSEDFFDICEAILETVDEYFGGIEHIDERLGYYYSDDYDESEDNKISDLKGKGAAMCVERAALAQNLLNSLGIKSFYKCSGIIKNDNAEVHSYNLVEYEGKYYIFDTSIPNIINGRISPLIAEIDKEAYELITCPLGEKGISISTKHFNPYRNIDVSITYDSKRQKSIEVEALGDRSFKM